MLTFASLAFGSDALTSCRWRPAMTPMLFFLLSLMLACCLSLPATDLESIVLGWVSAAGVDWDQLGRIPLHSEPVAL